METFHARCSTSQIVVMESARYGRMRVGECVKTDYGYVGCHANVMLQADRRCSGHHECEIHIPDPIFDAANPCPVEFKTYFEASYSCYQVETLEGYGCESVSSRLLTANNGYIANIVTEETNVGSITCPWIIRLLPGQRVSVTLHDFAMPLADISTDKRLCYEYAFINERDSSNRNVKVCGGATQMRDIFTSRSNEVEVRILKRSTELDGQYFMFHYKAIGCPILAAPQHGWVEQASHIAYFQCNFSDVSWHLRCEGNEWVGSHTYNCTASSSADTMDGVVVWGNLALPYGVSIGIIIGMAIIIGIIILLVGLLFLEWKKTRVPSAAGEMSEQGDADIYGYKDEGLYYKEGAPCDVPGQTHLDGNIQENTHSCYTQEVWSPQHQQQQAVVVPPCHYSTMPRFGRPTTFAIKNGGLDECDVVADAKANRRHIYESPGSLRRLMHAEGPHYFEADPRTNMVEATKSLQRPVKSTFPPPPPFLNTSPKTPGEENTENTNKVLGKVQQV